MLRIHIKARTTFSLALADWLERSLVRLHDIVDELIEDFNRLLSRIGFNLESTFYSEFSSFFGC